MHKFTNCVVICVVLMLTTLAEADIVPEKPTVLITGSNRGLGLEFVKQFTERGWNVIATARKPEQAEELNALAKKHKNITVEQLDPSEQQVGREVSLGDRRHRQAHRREKHQHHRLALQQPGDEYDSAYS